MKHIEQAFRLSAVVILVLTAAAKCVSATGHAPILDLPDPLFGVANRRLLVAVAMLEGIVAVGLLSRLDVKLKYISLGWLSGNFLTYRITLGWTHPGAACPCLGTITERLHLSPTTVNLLLWSTVLYFLVGSLCWLKVLPGDAATLTGRSHGGDRAL